MSRFRFVHAADLHLDTPFAGITRVAPAVGTALRDASLEAWDALVELTVRRRAAFLLLAGDIYDGQTRGVRAQLRFLRGLEQLAGHGIRTCIVHGNHDPLDGWSAIRSWPPEVTVFGGDAVQSTGIERDGQQLATVHGISFARREMRENLALRFRRGPEPGLHIGLLHCNAGGSAEHAAYSPCTIDDLRRARLDYWALGHLHRHQHLQEGEPWIVYPGNLQGRSPKPSELGEKGAVVVEVVDGAIAGVAFEALDRVRFVHLEVDVAACDDLHALRALLLRRAAALRSRHAGRGLLLRVTLHGRGALHDDLRRADAPDQLVETLREELATGSFENDSRCWIESLRVDTRAAIDKAAARQRADFAGELLRYGAQLGEDPPQLHRFADRQLSELAAAGLPGGGAGGAGEGAAGDLPALLGAAEDVALEALDALDALDHGHGEPPASEEGA